MVKRGPSTQSGNTITSMAAPAPSPFVVEAASSSSQLYPRTIGTSRSELSNSSVVFGESPGEARGSSPDSLICIVHRDSPLRQFGIQYAQSRNDKITVAHVFPETPGALANVPRGMVLRSVDGVVVRDIMEILPLVHGKLTLRLEFEPDAPASRSELSSFC